LCQQRKVETRCSASVRHGFQKDPNTEEETKDESIAPEKYDSIEKQEGNNEWRAQINASSESVCQILWVKSIRTILLRWYDLGHCGIVTHTPQGKDRWGPERKARTAQHRVSETARSERRRESESKFSTLSLGLCPERWYLNANSSSSKCGRTTQACWAVSST
jgi:hypothetical protein